MAEAKPLTLAHGIETRDGTLSKDARLKNCYVEMHSEGKAVRKRPGMTLVQTFTPTGGALSIQGAVNIATWPWVVHDRQLKPTTGLSHAAVNLGGMSYTRVEALSDTPLGTSILRTKYGMWVVVSTGGVVTATQVSDPDYPTVTVPGIVHLDGSYYVMTEKGEIYNSGVQAPLAWNALDFTSLEAGMGYGKTICRHLNYILAFGSLGCQLFYNAGNASGSPLLPVQNAAWAFGCLAPYSVRNISDATFWVSGSKLRAPQVLMMEGTQPKVISTPYIEKILQNHNLNTNENELGCVSSLAVRVDGHHFYVLHLGYTHPTLAFDLATGEWAEWSSVSAVGPNLFEGGFDWTWAVPTSPSGSSTDYIIRGNTGEVAKLSQTVYTDCGLEIRANIRTPPWDFHTHKRKFLPTVELIADNSSSIKFHCRKEFPLVSGTYC